ncbi:hypothetical protein PAXRUDRAFT_14050 [Paxillus rubicundulus Ve08.2h10]|uniref:Uncharacterized protein n=1 Tax=Paxillus rubicundulus Ve08.2h10 TaxID=930991 RepID=A0A0D0DIW8_9AGAM|nr:hypothetical protein PAXRUDRAFT_14050 [Paxillus rubicundulus Ve08.2h10]
MSRWGHGRHERKPRIRRTRKRRMDTTDELGREGEGGTVQESGLEIHSHVPGNAFRSVTTAETVEEGRCVTSERSSPVMFKSVQWEKRSECVQTVTAGTEPPYTLSVPIATPRSCKIVLLRTSRLRGVYIFDQIEPICMMNDATGDRIKAKYEGLAKVYEQHAKRLTVTGEDIGPNSEDSSDGTCRCFIKGAGPNESTPKEVRNIWDDVVSQFPFFPDLHPIWAIKPNKNPIVVTTGVGPSGKRTLIMQPLTNSRADNEASKRSEVEFTNSQIQEI